MVNTTNKFTKNSLITVIVFITLLNSCASYKYRGTKERKRNNYVTITSDNLKDFTVSNTLDGKGNLYSFIGFYAWDQPVQDVVDAIDKNTRIQSKNSKDWFFNFEFLTPSLEELGSYTPLPFEGGNSWLKGIEKGISGFSNYVYGLLFPTSRSGRGIQSENQIRRASYKPTKYFSASNFVISLIFNIR